MIDLNKPYPHEHAARLYEPSKLDPKAYHRTHGGQLYGGNVKVPASIDVVWGKTKDADHPIAQALRFPTDKWTEEKARKWLKDNGIHSIKFEPASGDVEKADSDVLVQAWDTLSEHYNHSYEKKDRKGTVHSALFLKSIYEVLTTRKDVVVRGLDSTVLPFVRLQRDVRDCIDVTKLHNNDKVIGMNLLVLNKETTPLKGILKYTLGCWLDKSKPARGDNLVEVAKINDFDSGARLDEVVYCEVSGCAVEKRGNLFAPLLQISKVGTGKKTPPDKSLSILKASHEAGILTVDKETLIEMSDKKLFDINIDKQFGVEFSKDIPIIKGDLKEGVVYGIVYPVNEVDADGDYATPEEVQKACWRFMKEFQTMNLMHNQYLPGQAYSVVECACSLADINVGGQKIKKGDWYIAVMVEDPELKGMIERGEIAAFSMEGSAMPGQEIPLLESQKRRAA